MKKIKLVGGLYTLVDDNDFEFLSRYKWYAVFRYNCFYVQRNNVKLGEYISMHRMVLKAPRGLVVDHINHDTLDNRKSNLRLATRSQNLWNQNKYKNNTTGYKGVFKSNKHKEDKWYSRIQVCRKRIWLGYFDDPKSAAQAYDRAALVNHGNFATLNFPNFFSTHNN